MVEVDKKREATASIRGYFYQLDATLLDILTAKLNDEVVIEGVEDFDRYSHGEITYHQVKYCESQKLTNSILRDPLFKLFSHFYQLQPVERADRKYILFGHYKEIKIDFDDFDAEQFKKIMTYTKTEKDKSRTKKSLLDELNCPDELINQFCSKFEFRTAKKFSEQRNEVVNKLRSIQGVSEVEASGFHYPRAFNFVAVLAAEKEHCNRVTSLGALQKHLKGTQAIHHSWMLREKKTTEYTRYMRKLYFSDHNTAGVIRAFVLEIDKPTSHDVIIDQIMEIAKKWSTYKITRTPNAERRAPFVILRNADTDLIERVKNSLYDQGIEFVDGFPYRGSPFREDHARLAQTKDRAVAIRIVDDLNQLLAALKGMRRKPCRIYDFFTNEPVNWVIDEENIRGFSIPIDKIDLVKKII